STWRARPSSRGSPSPSARRGRTRRSTSAPKRHRTRSLLPTRRNGPAGIQPGPSSDSPWPPGSSPATRAGWRSARAACFWSCRRVELRLLLLGPVEIVQLLLDALADVARDVLDLALELVELALTLELAIAGGDAHGLLDAPFDVLGLAFDALLVHRASFAR